jgi:hypothetical protein
MQIWEGLTILGEASALELNGGHQSRGSSPSLSLNLSVSITPINTACSSVSNCSSISSCQQGVSSADAGPETLIPV